MIENPGMQKSCQVCWHDFCYARIVPGGGRLLDSVQGSSSGLTNTCTIQQISKIEKGAKNNCRANSKIVLDTQLISCYTTYMIWRTI